METKTDFKQLNSKLLEFQKKVGAISKDGKNPHFKSTYATLSNTLSEVKPVLSELGLVLSQPVRDNKVFTIISDSASNHFTEACIELPAGLTPQQMGSAITYYRRYLLAGLLSLEMEDDDANITQNADTRQWLNEGTPPYVEAVKFLKAGNTIDAIEKKYKINKTTREKLVSEAI
jgi:hypothetical protein